MHNNNFMILFFFAVQIVNIQLLQINERFESYIHVSRIYDLL